MLLCLGGLAQLLDAAHHLRQLESFRDAGRYLGLIALAFALLIPLFGVLGWERARRLHRRLVEGCRDQLEASLAARPLPWTVAFAALALLIEMSVIRWTSYRGIAEYRNLPLLGCFLGLGLGFLSGRRRPDLVPWLLPILGLQYLAMRLVGELDQLPAAEPHALAPAIATISLSPAWLFVLVAIATLAPGQLVGATLAGKAGLPGYGANLAGSLLGVAAAHVLAALWTSPTTWLALIAFVYLIAFPGRATLGSAALLAIPLGLANLATPLEQTVVYSPYQRLGVRAAGFGHALGDGRMAITANSVYYQSIPAIDTRRIRPELDVRHQIPNADLAPVAARLPGARVLALGAGAGANLSDLLRAGVAEVVAVDIDPVIVHLGRKLNSDQPFADPRVRIVVDDARAFLRRSRERFDLILFFWIDSHPGSSSSSGLRLDSFVYTRESFESARARLAPGGAMLVYAWMPREARLRILRTLESVFGAAVHTFRVAPWEAQWLFAVGSGIDTSGTRWVVPAALPAASADLITDDWPFLYLAEGWAGGAGPGLFLSFVLVASLIGVRLVRSEAPVAGARPRMFVVFFLFGVAFMLLETTCIMQLALLFGNTWQVTGMAIVAILAMAFLANLLVLRRWMPGSRRHHALLLVGSLVAVWAIRAEEVAMLGDPRLFRILYLMLAACPVAFSSLLFSRLLDRFPDVDRALGSNLLGAMAGGGMEYAAMLIGYRSLTLVIPAVYMLALGVAWLERGARPEA